MTNPAIAPLRERMGEIVERYQTTGELPDYVDVLPPGPGEKTGSGAGVPTDGTPAFVSQVATRRADGGVTVEVAVVVNNEGDEHEAKGSAEIGPKGTVEYALP